jgi:hypothetical protein
MQHLFNAESPQEILEELRGTEEFQAIEKAVGKINLATGSNGSQYDDKTNTIIYDSADLGIEYNTTLPNDIPDNFDWDGYPDTNTLSTRRILFHEATHATQPSGMKFLMNRSYYENESVHRTNKFMWKHHGDPLRDGY